MADWKKTLVIICLSWTWIPLIAQPIQIKGGFQEDSLLIGKEVSFWLTASYPRNLEVIFPDSTYDYAPFELNQKVFFKTKSDSLVSYDSVIYQLTSFEIEKVQHLSLPVFVIKEGDSITWESNSDSVFLAEMITTLPDSLDLKANTEFNQVPLQFNYPYVIAGLAIFLVLATVIILVFGKGIKRQYLLYRLKKNHEKFVVKFRELVAHLDPSSSSERSEEILVLWKRYMEKLERKPFTKLTTKEILASPENSPLKKPLRAVDENIYGNISHSDLRDCFEDLEYFSSERYNFKIERVKNG